MDALSAERGSSAMQDAAEEPWHVLTPELVLNRLDCGIDGLSTEEVHRRRELYGPNELAAAKRQNPVLRFIRQFHNVLLYVMSGAAVITAILQHWVDTAVLFAAVVINAVIAFLQEGKAEAAMEAIRRMLSPHATVIREGRTVDIDAADVVPGDVIRLASGDRVPADVRLLSTDGLLIDESALTGESVPVEKSTLAVPADAPVGDRVGMAYSGTLVVHGQGTGIVVGTGSDTELGRINRMLAGIAVSSTPLLRQIDKFGRLLAAVILLLAAGTFVLGVLARGHAPSEMFMMVVALAASAIPEGLPAIMTVTLAIGVQRMSRRHAIVRRLPAVEALGSVTVICSDKTGTLTSNEMTVQRVVCGGHEFDVGGVGYAPVGDITVDGRIIDPVRYPVLEATVRAGVLCNDSSLRQEDDAWTITGDPTEAALLVLGEKLGMPYAHTESRCPRTDSVPFESEIRMMGTLHSEGDDEPLVLVKGAPERVIALCDRQRDPHGDHPLEQTYWQRMAAEIAAQGLRVLALAQRRGHQRVPGQLTLDDLDGGYTLLGLVGIIDPLRPEALTAVRECHRAGIKVKMITGDHAATAREIGAQLGIGVGKPAVTGVELAEMDDARLRTVAKDCDVFARASPEHKLRLVRALQSDGEVVAMTGDGVNDAPALKRADIGVAMGDRGTEAAKESSDIVLADDNFATIAAAVAEGRTVYDNIRKFILFMLPTNGGEALVVIAAILFELTLPLTPAQVLWINLVTSATLGLALAFEPPEHDVMDRRPRPPNENLLSRHFLWRVGLVSVLMAGGALSMFLWELRQGTSVETARTMAVNAIVVAEMFYLLNNRFLLEPVLNRVGLFGNRIAFATVVACVALTALFTYTPAMNAVFGSAPLTWVDWLKAAGVGAAVFSAVELEKLVVRRYRGRRTQALAAVTHST
ncbi:cation-transporting P-type ATPase [Mycolicibacterium sp. ND9-15]|uniref:cation-transporting P-type ATPase n=1 Tax=Mycolicibacterium sp. ND9-15 TaxID=3042320 RepID=UPI002DDB2D64|nr:cation-transporting P-type ATPase [Mycolicibacterium sp. ND9-15]WSE58091.1 cation-transporting P-type ATPase [Mycolicibacterium sp. ND9-15]